MTYVKLEQIDNFVLKTAETTAETTPLATKDPSQQYVACRFTA